MKSNYKQIIFIFLILFVAVIGVLHYTTPGYMILYHDTYRRLSYFPIAIGAILYGLRGGIALALLSCVAFVPHLFTFWYQGMEAYYSELSEILFYLSAGIIIGFIASREHKLRDKYRLLSENLATSYKRLHEQTGRLVQAEKQLSLSKKLSMLGHVSASLAHEIKNPLASIKGAAEILADEVPEEHPKYEFMEIMRSEISRLNNSVEDVLSYCRGQQNGNEKKIEPVEQTINRVAFLMDGRLKEKSITLSIHSKKNAEPFFTDEDALIQVLMNIVLNAIEAVNPRGKIVINHYPGDKGYHIDVSDSGPGIDESIKENIFNPFTTFKEGGTGLGLSITKKIVESLGGRISLANEESGGAKFLIWLPETSPLGSGTVFK